MSPREVRLAELSTRAVAEREELASAVREVRQRIDEKQKRLRSLGFWAGLLVSSMTSTYRLFGRNTLSARVNRWSTLGSILVSIARFLFRLFG
jgi:hypothetical protein